MGIRGCSVLFSWDFRCQLSPWSVQKGGFRGDGKCAAQQVAELRHGWWHWGHEEKAAAAAHPGRSCRAGTGGHRACCGGSSTASNAGSVSLPLAARVSSPALRRECGFMKILSFS